MNRPAAYLTLLLILVDTALGKGLPLDHAQFKKAEQLLIKGNYEKALAGFEQLQRHGIKTPALFGDMAIAYCKTDEIGKAVLYNEKALLLSPLDEQLLQNRSVIKPRVADDVNEDGAASTVSRPFAGLMIDIAFLGIVLLFAGSLTFFVWSLTRTPVWQLKVRHAWQVLIGLGVFLALTGWLDLAMQAERAVIMAATSEARTGPGELAKIVFELKEGEQVELTNSYEKWDKVKKNDGAEGWVPASEIAIIQY